jgi:hypothetical protein
MSFRIGVFAYPAFILVIQMARPNAVHAFEKAGAFSLATSRKPQSLEVPRRALVRAVKKKLLLPTGDGRYYLDRHALKRSDRRTLWIMALGLLAFLPLVWVMW